MALSKKRKSGSEIWFATWVDTQKVLFSTAKALVTKQRPEPAPKKELDLQH